MYQMTTYFAPPSTKLWICMILKFCGIIFLIILTSIGSHFFTFFVSTPWNGMKKSSTNLYIMEDTILLWYSFLDAISETKYSKSLLLWKSVRKIKMEILSENVINVYFIRHLDDDGFFIIIGRTVISSPVNI